MNDWTQARQRRLAARELRVLRTEVEVCSRVKVFYPLVLNNDPSYPTN